MDPDYLRSPDELKIYGTELYNLLVPFTSVKYKFEPKTILRVVDDIFYFWSPKEFCVVAIFKPDLIPVFNGKYQLLRPNLPIDYEVTSLEVNETSTRLAVVCDCRIMILKLPERKGHGMYFLNGIDSILCSAMYVDWIVNDFIKRVRWVYDYLIVLYDENVEVRDSKQENAPRVHHWRVKKTVDFELIMPLRDEKYYQPENSNRVSILLLKENGDVHTVNFYIIGDGFEFNFENKDYEGLVSMYPPPEDNYGVEAYSILLLDGSSPKKVVIGSRTGVLNHFVILTKEKDRPYIPTQEIFLYAIGIVELDLTGVKLELAEDKDKDRKKKKKKIKLYQAVEEVYEEEEEVEEEEEEEDKGKEMSESQEEISFDEETIDEFMTAIALVPDSTSDLRYFALHKAGLHCITVPKIEDFQEFVKTLECAGDNLHLRCTADCIVVTRSNITTKSHAPFGVVCVDVLRPFLIMVFHSSIKSKYYGRGSCLQIPTTEHDLYVALDGIPTIPYIDLVEGETEQPMAKMELLCLMENHFRTNVFPHFKNVKKMMTYCETKASKLKQQQLAKLEEIKRNKIEVQSKAEQLAEKCEEFNEKNNELSKRLYECVKVINSLEPNQRAEKMMNKILIEQGKKLHYLKDQLKLFYDKVDIFRAVVQRNIRDFGFDQYDFETGSDTQLSEEQLKRMKSILNDMTKQIEQTVDSVHQLPPL